jgi:NAD(P)-dependent dehydrogenase (short-subunit alcohol dehydrogenase family)
LSENSSAGREWSEKVAVVTGGTAGIGAATADLLAAKGVRVVLSGRRVSLGEDRAAAIRAAGGQAIFVAGDAGVKEDVDRLVATALDSYGRLDIGVNNAGAALEMTPLDEADGELLEAMHRTNVMGSFWAMQGEIRAMLAGGGGTIVNVASDSGLGGQQSAGTYASTKHAVVGLTKSAALDYARRGIRINAVAPGPVLSEAMSRVFESGAYREADVAEMVPLGRLGSPHEIAQAIAWLAGPESSFVVGAVLSVDGGTRAR